MRSTSAADYQDLPRALVVLAKDFPAGATTSRHSHPRAQLLYATRGLMVATTAHGTWVVPLGHALLIPPHLQHEVTMHGAVAMRTAYLAADAGPITGDACRVIEVSRLLDAALLALAAEPALYEIAGRGTHLAALILDEIARAPAAPFTLPLPADSRLRKLCRALIDAPGLPHDIDGWADRIGMSRRTLTRHFRAETGLSFGEWRRRLRLLHTLKRQAEGDALHRLAAAVGYRSPQALRAMIRRAAGGPRL